MWFDMIKRAYAAHQNVCDLEKFVGVKPGTWQYNDEDAQRFYAALDDSGLGARLMRDTPADLVAKMMSETYARACWYRLGKPTFDLGPGFVYECVETSCGAATHEDVLWPFPVYMLHIDPKHSPLYSMLSLDQTQVGVLAYILVGNGMKANVHNDAGDIVNSVDILSTYTYHTSEDVASVHTRLPENRKERIEETLKFDTKGIKSAGYNEEREFEEIDSPMAERYSTFMLRIVFVTALRMSHKQKENAEHRDTLVRQGKTGNPILFKFGHDVTLDMAQRERVIAYGKATAHDVHAEHALFVRGHAQRYHVGSGEKKTVEWRSKAAYRKGQGSTLERTFKVRGNGDGESPPPPSSEPT